MGKSFRMKKQILRSLFLAILLLSSGILVFAQKSSKISSIYDDEVKIIKTQAKEYFKAILDKDYETIFKYVHPNIVEGMGGKKAVIARLKHEIVSMEKDEVRFGSISVAGIDLANDKEAAILAIVNHKSGFGVPKVVEEYNGKMKVYRLDGKNYFINNKGLIGLIIDSLGIKEFEIDEDDEELEIVETKAMEYFNAVLNEDYKTIYKYVHPNLAKTLGDKKTVIDLLKLGIDEMGKKGMGIASISVTEIAMSNDEKSDFSATVSHKTAFSLPDVEVKLEGHMKVYRFKGKHYFINSKGMILDSFGIKEFEKKDGDDPEKNSDPR